MQYAILIYDEPGSYEALAPEEFERVMAEYGPITQPCQTRRPAPPPAAGTRTRPKILTPVGDLGLHPLGT